jgi:flagellar hook-basal body complex protein FliE
VIGAVAGLGPSFLTRPAGGVSSSVGPGFAAEAAPVPGGPASTSFAAALGRLAGGTVDTLRGAEATSLDALQGKADTRAVVDAVMGAEQSLQTAVAIRDKIVSAFLEVSRMAI